MAIQSSAFAAQTYGPTRTGDMLWHIAAQVPVDASVNRQQVMLALLRINPHAFRIPCNMNSLKVGQTLTLPTLSDIKQLTPAEALNTFEQQNETWKTFLRQNTPIVCPSVPKQVHLMPSHVEDNVITPQPAPLVEIPTRVDDEVTPLAQPEPTLTNTPSPVTQPTQLSQAAPEKIDMTVLSTVIPWRYEDLLSYATRFMQQPLFIILLCSLTLGVGWLIGRRHRKIISPITEATAEKVYKVFDEEEKLTYIRTYLAEGEEKAIQKLLKDIIDRGTPEQQEEARQLIAINKKMNTLELQLVKGEAFPVPRTKATDPLQKVIKQLNQHLSQQDPVEDREKVFGLVDKVFELLDQELNAQGKLVEAYKSERKKEYLEAEAYTVLRKPEKVVVEENLESTLKKFRQTPKPTRRL